MKKNAFRTSSPGIDSAAQLATGKDPLRSRTPRADKATQIAIDNKTPNVDPILPAGLREVNYDAKRAGFRPLSPNEFGSKDKPQRTYKVFKIDFNAGAGTDVEIPISGNVIFFADSTNGSDSIQLKYDSKQADFIPLKAGIALNNWTFDKLYITWANIVGATGYLFIGSDPEGTFRVT